MGFRRLSRWGLSEPIFGRTRTPYFGNYLSPLLVGWFSWSLSIYFSMSLLWKQVSCLLMTFSQVFFFFFLISHTFCNPFLYRLYCICRLYLNNLHLCFSIIEFLNKQNHLGCLYSGPGCWALGSHLHIPMAPYSWTVFLCFCLWLIIINGLGIELLSDVK